MLPWLAIIEWRASEGQVGSTDENLEQTYTNDDAGLTHVHGGPQDDCSSAQQPRQVPPSVSRPTALSIRTRCSSPKKSGWPCAVCCLETIATGTSGSPWCTEPINQYFPKPLEKGFQKFLFS